MGNKIGVYGVPEMINIHGSLREQRPAEVTAALHILNPTAPRFVEAPAGPPRFWCTGCRAMKNADEFHQHAGRPNGHQPYCKACRKAKRKMGKHKPLDAGHWYRS